MVLAVRLDRKRRDAEAYAPERGLVRATARHAKSMRALRKGYGHFPNESPLNRHACLAGRGRCVSPRLTDDARNRRQCLDAHLATTAHAA